MGCNCRTLGRVCPFIQIDGSPVCVSQFYLFWVLFNFSSILSPPLSPSVCLYTLLVFTATESYQVYICPVFK